MECPRTPLFTRLRATMISHATWISLLILLPGLSSTRMRDNARGSTRELSQTNGISLPSPVFTQPINLADQAHCSDEVNSCSLHFPPVANSVASNIVPKDMLALITPTLMHKPWHYSNSDYLTSVHVLQMCHSAPRALGIKHVQWRSNALIAAKHCLA